MRRALSVPAQLAPLPVALLAAQAFAGSLWKHPTLFYGVMAALLGLFVRGLVGAWGAGPRGRAAAVSLALALLVLSFVPMWFSHVDDTPAGTVRHGHTLWEPVHVH